MMTLGFKGLTIIQTEMCQKHRSRHSKVKAQRGQTVA